MSRFAAISVLFAGLAGLAAVALGAWAAHGGGTAPRGTLETASVFALGHAATILALALLRERLAGSARAMLDGAVIAFAVGTALFAGALALGGGLAVPVGGTLLLIGWASLAAGAVAAFKRPGRSLRHHRPDQPKRDAGEGHQQRRLDDVGEHER
jgi:uncharacterized membrane protein YgdD (TMEM256/DUF423 family)